MMTKSTPSLPRPKAQKPLRKRILGRLAQTMMKMTTKSLLPLRLNHTMCDNLGMRYDMIMAVRG